MHNFLNLLAAYALALTALAAHATTEPGNMNGAMQANSGEVSQTSPNIDGWDAVRVQELQRNAAKSLGREVVFRDCDDCPEMVVIPAGRFTMGAPPDEKGHDSDERPQHEVGLKPFALGKTEVTQGQWRTIMDNNPSHFRNCGDNCPVENVSWDDIQEFIRKLNVKTGKQYRLLSEAEWEYACRAGGNHTYCGSNDITAVAWHGNGRKLTQPVGRKRANAWGLHDMSGNVWEWVQDCYNDSYDGAPIDGSAWTSGNCSVRVLRGGSWVYDPDAVRSAMRFGNDASGRGNLFGFRLARMLP